MIKLKANKVLFIKLGRGGEFEKECIENNQTLRVFPILAPQSNTAQPLL
jgi:hypothetical protein